jgi:hypothetical protein
VLIMVDCVSGSQKHVALFPANEAARAGMCEKICFAARPW